MIIRKCDGRPAHWIVLRVFALDHSLHYPYHALTRLPKEKSFSLAKLGYPDIIYIPQCQRQDWFLILLHSKVYIMIYCKWIATLNLHLRELDNGFLQVGEVSSNNSLLNLTIFVENKCWHGLDTQFLSNVGLLIDVERIKLCILEFFGPPKD